MGRIGLLEMLDQGERDVVDLEAYRGLGMQIEGVRQAMKTRRPAGFSARRMLRKAATGSAKNMTPKREKTRS